MNKQTQIKEQLLIFYCIARSFGFDIGSVAGTYFSVLVEHYSLSYIIIIVFVDKKRNDVCKNKS